LLHEYPFKFKGNEEGAFREEFMSKCGEGFRFRKELEQTNFDAPPLKCNKLLEDFFRRIFHPIPTKRITIAEIKEHPLFETFFPGQIDPEMLAVIQENGR
jgi:serine/threonine protein kinase